MSDAFPYWAWLLTGLALCAAETVVPGAFLIFIGAAGLIVGLIELLYPMPLEAQSLVFAGLAAALALAGRRIYGSVAAFGPPPTASRAEALVGHEYFLESPIERGFGRIRVGDSVWRVAGPDMPAGERVKVVAVDDGVELKVEKVHDAL